MKKITNLLLLISVIALFSSSCGNYRSITTVTKVSQLRGNPFMYYLSKSLLKSVSNYASKNNIKGTGKVNLVSNVADVFTTGEQMAGLRELMMVTYNIPAKKMGEFDKVVTFRDLIMFVRKNGRNFNFYSTNSSK